MNAKQKRLPLKADVPGHKGVGNLHGPMTMWLLIHAGEATMQDGEELSLAYTMGGSPVISHGSGKERRSWTLTWQQLVDLAIDNGILDKSNGKLFK